MPGARLREVGSRLAILAVLILALHLGWTQAAPWHHESPPLETQASKRPGASAQLGAPFSDEPAPRKKDECGDTGAGKAELQELLDALDDPDYQVRWKACRKMGRKGHCWLNGQTEGTGEDDPCLDGPNIYTLFIETFTRNAGGPSELSREFAVTAEGSFCVRVVTADVASAVISLDGQPLFVQSDFNHNVELLTARPELEEGLHTLDVWLASQPGASLTVEVRFRPTEDYDQIVEFFEQALEDPSENVVREAIVAAGLVPIIPTWEILKEVTHYERGCYSSLTRVIAVEALVSASNALYPSQPGPVEALAEVLFGDPAASPRMAAAVGLAKLGNPLGIEVLETALASEPTPMIQEVIQRALAQLRAITGIPFPDTVTP